MDTVGKRPTELRSFYPIGVYAAFLEALDPMKSPRGISIPGQLSTVCFMYTSLERKYRNRNLRPHHDLSCGQ